MGHDGGMSLLITVRGSAEQRFAAERAVVVLAAVVEGDDKATVMTEATAVQRPLTEQLAELAGREAVTTWSSDQVHVFSHRPWDGEGKRLPVVHTARVQVQAEFVDFERLSGFLDYWSGKDGVEVQGITWDVSAKNRRTYEADVRKAAIDDALAKAQTYATATRRGKVVAEEIADAGMLSGHAESGGPVPMMKAVAMDVGGGGGLVLTPEQILVAVEVDARFRAD